jgi:predicted porin
MKYRILAAAAFTAISGITHAQNVTLYGLVDAGLRHVTNTNAAGDDKLTMSSKGTYSSNRFGLKGVEDLGGGMNAHFVLEGGFNSGTGELDNTASVLFRRQAFVGIGSSWGTLDLGRQYTIAFKSANAYDPFNYKYTDIIPVAGAATGARMNNDIQYTGAFGPWTVRAEYALGEVAGSTSDGSAIGAGVDYVSGPLVLGGAYTRRKPAPTFLENKNLTLGGAYSFGELRVSAGYIDERQATTGTDTTTKNVWAGASYAVSPAFAVTGAFYQTRTSTAGADGKRNLAMVGGTYSLSKRTLFYAAVDNSRLSGTTAKAANNQTSQTGISAGIFHSF